MTLWGWRPPPLWNYGSIVIKSYWQRHWQSCSRGAKNSLKQPCEQQISERSGEPRKGRRCRMPELRTSWTPAPGRLLNLHGRCLEIQAASVGLWVAMTTREQTFCFLSSLESNPPPCSAALFTGYPGQSLDDCLQVKGGSSVY